MWDWRFNIRRAAGFQGIPSAILKNVVWSAETYLKSLINKIDLYQIISICSYLLMAWRMYTNETFVLYTFQISLVAIRSRQNGHHFCKRHFQNNFLVWNRLYFFEFQRNLFPAKRQFTDAYVRPLGPREFNGRHSNDSIYSLILDFLVVTVPALRLLCVNSALPYMTK